LILMIAGAAGLVLGFVQQAIWTRRSRRAVTLEERRDPEGPRSKNGATPKARATRAAKHLD
jgi:hypothetical protein